MGYIPPFSSYSPLLLSHQTGLSVTVSSGNTFYAIGSSISIPRGGILFISMSGHVSADEGYIQLSLTRGGNTFTYGSTNNSLFGNTGYYDKNNYISNTSSLPLFATGNFNQDSGIYSSGTSPSFILPVYENDSLQFYATNNDTNETVYIDDLLVILL
ncbi:MAG: hypothetical protein QXU98_08050 [Candidatus Parvarchaeota archaeon]